ncbi:juvenile hormone esterase isoform X2 [Procambarus clarkii]|uniref:juvenile hormone esterase isoform X2 n=1 Tax=Procambarus clarkii TaxID=6728 RepID=UPI0037439590
MEKIVKKRLVEHREEKEFCNTPPTWVQIWMLMLALCGWVVAVMGSEAGYGYTSQPTSHVPPVVHTRAGATSGITEESTKGRRFFSYYGIPYAKPPVGQLRLQDPVAAEAWGGVRNGSVLPQPCVHVPFLVSVAGSRLQPQMLPGVEDCLYLNVFTPRVELYKRLPVMVFIHGGGFYSGGTNEYLPHVLLNHDIVLVVLQYRIGILGFLSTEDAVIPGNLGLKDQTLALHWVQENIHNFGGDPNRVTIFGESAGGSSVHFHVLSPKSRGLFSRVIMQSGTAISPFSTGGHHREVAEHVGYSLGCDASQGSRHLLACLQTLDAKNLSATIQDFFEWLIAPLPLRPRVDGDFLPDKPEILLRERRYNPVDIIIGTTSHEGMLIGYPLFAGKEVSEALLTNFSHVGPLSLLCDDCSSDPADLASRIYTHYLGGVNFDLQAQSSQLIRMFSEYHFQVPQDIAVLMHAKHSHPYNKMYSYELEHRGQLSFGDFFVPELSNNFVSHADDLYYLFRGGPFLQPPFGPPSRPKDLEREVDLTVRDLITTMWTNFAAFGNPTPDGSLGFVWEPVHQDNYSRLAITTAPAMKSDDRRQSRDFLTSLPTPQNFILFPEKVTPAYSGSQFLLRQQYN